MPAPRGRCTAAPYLVTPDRRWTIIVQAAVPVLADDTPTPWPPACWNRNTGLISPLRLLAQGKVSVDGNRKVEAPVPAHC